MLPEEKAAYVFAQSASALIEAMGMMSDNAYRIKSGLSPAFVGSEFDDLITKYGIGPNDVLNLYQQ